MQHVLCRLSLAPPSHLIMHQETSDNIFESLGIRKSLMLIVFQQMADLDASKIWFYKYCENIWVTGIEADVN